jgi:hypothetical protein
METSNYGVEFEEFTARHFIKSFEKKYKTAWSKTQEDVVEVCKHIDIMLQLKRADLISENESHKLVKLDFAVEGTKVSPKASGNRCILHIDEELHVVRILIVYSKNDISEPNETQKWKTMVKEQFPHIGTIFSL